MASTKSKGEPRPASASAVRLDRSQDIARDVARLRRWLRHNPRKAAEPGPGLRRVTKDDRERVIGAANRISRYARCKENPHVDHEDLIQESILVNLEAARCKGSDLSSDSCLKRANRRMNAAVREARRQLPGRLDADCLAGDDELTPLDRAGEDDALVYSRGLLDMRPELDRIMRRLPRRLRLVLILRFGLDAGPPLAAEDIGHALRLSSTRIYTLEKAAVARLRSIAQREAPDASFED